jgi:hypothetical protein
MSEKAPCWQRFHGERVISETYLLRSFC